MLQPQQQIELPASVYFLSYKKNTYAIEGYQSSAALACHFCKGCFVASISVAGRTPTSPRSTYPSTELEPKRTAGQIYCSECLYKKKRELKINELSNSREQQNKHRERRRKETIKIRVKINQTQNKYTVEESAKGKVHVGGKN